MPGLFDPFRLGALTLKNRLVMAPMTRSRADVYGVPTAPVADYYAQRASMGLIVTEGTQPSFMGQGYVRTPGIHTPAQIAGWRRVTDAVHGAGGTIFCQIMHAGRVAHRFNRVVSDAPVAPSAVRADTRMYTDAAGMRDCAMPRALALDDIPAVIDEYREAAINALAAGFDGVELHAMSGYLPNQFLAPNVNLRTDHYGGSVENRCRFVLETLDAMIDGAGDSSKVAMRISPGFTFNDIHDPDPAGTYGHLAGAVDRRGLAYLHVQRAPEFRQSGTDGLAMVRPHFRGPIVACGGYDRAQAEADLDAGRADLIAFGTLALANPDLPERLKKGGPFNPPDQATFYSPGARGLTDYPTL